MPIVLTGLDRMPAGALRLVASPLVELGTALHVLNDPGHHRVLPARPAALVESLERWSFTFRAVRARPFLEPSGAGVADWAAERARLDQAAPDELALALIRPLRAQTGTEREPVSPEETRLRARHWAAARGPDVEHLVGELLAEPARAVEEFRDLLDRCWESFFAAEWARIRPLLAQRVGQGRDLLRRDGPLALLDTLSPAIRVDRRRGRATLEKVQNRRIDVSERGLVLVPSAFIAPHLYVGDEPGLPLTVLYPAMPTTAPPALAHAELLARLTALAHPVRLQVCRAVATEPRTAGEIASLWRLEPTQVTKHLRALTRARILRAERSGRYVRYTLDDTAVRLLGGDVADFLQR